MIDADLVPYVPRGVHDPERLTWDVDGSVVFADVSGFTKLSEKLAEQGKAGAEELTDILLGTFTDLLGEARAEGGDLLSFGGDALMLLYDGNDHAVRATRAAVRMRAALKARGPVETGKGRVVLRISQGVHTGRFHMVLAGIDQRELLVVGPDATHVTDIEGAASAGQVVVSDTTARLLPSPATGAKVGVGHLLRRLPPEVPVPIASHPETIDRQRLVPPAVLRRVRSGGLDAEHRRVAVGFVHIAGVDRHLAEFGTAATAAALHEMTAAVAEAADDAGACLLASDLAPDGAKLIVTAGAPEAVEDADGRLLVALRSAVAKPHPLPIRAGAHSGHVFASEVGAPWRHVYTVIGDAVNLSARLMGKAEPGQVVASSALLDRSATPFETDPLEPFMVKGKRHAQHASVVGDRIEGRGRAEALRAPLVGREPEVEALDRAVHELREGRGSCIEIVGPAGIGKSRLVAELTERAGDIDRIRIVCEPFQVDVPYYVARLVVRRLLGIPMDADRNDVGRRLTTAVDRHAPALAWALPLLAIAAEATVEMTPEVDRLAPANRADALAEAAAELAAAVIVDPLLLVFEDATWMDGASAKVVARLLRDVRLAPCLVCTTIREPGRGLHTGLGYDATVLDLEPLSAEHAREIVELMTEERGLSAHDVERLCARANGNPLFLIELLRAVFEAGSLEELPGGLEDIMAARIDRLPPHDRQLLRVSAVLGDRFDQQLLAEMVADDGSLSSAIGGPLDEFFTVDGDDLMFAHDLLRQVAYEGLPYARRRNLHRRAATTLEARPGRPDDDRLAMLAHHWDRAGERLEAWNALTRSAERARRKSAFHEASVLLERALDNGRRAAVEEYHLGEVAEQLGDTAELAARYDVAIDGYRLARRHTAEDDVRQIDLLRKEGLVREKAGRYDAALRWLRRGLAAVGDGEDPESLARRAKLEVAVAGVRFRQGKLRTSVGWCERAIDDAQRCNDEGTLANALYVIEGALADLDDPRAAEYVGRSVEIYRRLGDDIGLGRALLNMGVSADRLGRLDEAAELYEQSREALLAAGWFIGLAHVSLNLGGIRADQGRLEEAERHLKDARRVASASRYEMITWAAVSGLGRVATRARLFDRAHELLAQSVEEFDRMGAAGWAAEAQIFRAETHVFESDAIGAFEALEAAGSYGDEAISGSGAAPLAMRVEGAALALAGRVSESVEMLHRCVADAEGGDSDVDLMFALAELARCAGIDPHAADEAQQGAEVIASRLGVDLDVVCRDRAVAVA